MASLISASDVEATLPLNAVFQQTFLRQATPLALYFTGTKPGTLERNKGTATVKWRRLTAITPSTTALSEQTGSMAFFGGRSTDVTALTDVNALVAKYGQVVALSEEVEIYSEPEQVDEIVKSLAIAGGRALNLLQRNIATNNLTKVYAGGAASTAAVTSKITKASIDKVVQTLVTNVANPFTPMTRGDTNVGTAPILPAFWGLCDQYVAYDLKGLAGFQSVETYAGQVATMRGEIGLIASAGYAVRFLMSSEGLIDADSGGSVTGTGLVSTSATSIDINHTVIYGEDCLGSVGLGKPQEDGTYVANQEEMPNTIDIILHERGSSGVADPFNEIKTIAYKTFHSGAVLNSGWGRQIISGATSL